MTPAPARISKLQQHLALQAIQVVPGIAITAMVMLEALVLLNEMAVGTAAAPSLALLALQVIPGIACSAMVLLDPLLLANEISVLTTSSPSLAKPIL